MQSIVWLSSKLFSSDNLSQLDPVKFDLIKQVVDDCTATAFKYLQSDFVISPVFIFQIRLFWKMNKDHRQIDRE